MHEWQEDTKSREIYMRQDRDRQGNGKGGGGLGVRLPSGGVQVCPARPSAHDFTVFRPLLINFRPSGICKVTESGKHTQERCTEKITYEIFGDPFKER